MTNYSDTLNLNQGNATDKMRSAVGADHLNKSDAHTEDSDDNFNVGSQVNVGRMKFVGNKTLEGSYAGDHRTPANTTDLTAGFKNQKGPRGETNEIELEGV